MQVCEPAQLLCRVVTNRASPLTDALFLQITLASLLYTPVLLPTLESHAKCLLTGECMLAIVD
jgi:hypothetical protein